MVKSGVATPFQPQTPNTIFDRVSLASHQDGITDLLNRNYAPWSIMPPAQWVTNTRRMP